MHNGGELVMEGVSADVLAESDSCSEPLDDKDLPSCSLPALPTLEVGDGDADLFGDLESPWSGGQRRNDVPWNKLSRDNNGPDDFPVRPFSSNIICLCRSLLCACRVAARRTIRI